MHQGRSVRAFAQAIFTGLSSQDNQLTQAWSKLDPSLRKDIPDPTESTKVADFLAHLEAKEDIWHGIVNVSQRHGDYQNQNRQFSNYSMHGRGYRGSSYSQREPFANPYQFYQGFSIQNYPNSKTGTSTVLPKILSKLNLGIMRQHLQLGILMVDSQKRIGSPRQQSLPSNKPTHHATDQNYAGDTKSTMPKQPWNCRSTAYQASIEDSEGISDSDLSINTANDSVLPYEDSPNKEHYQEAEIQELEKSFPDSFELGNEMETDDYAWEYTILSSS